MSNITIKYCKRWKSITIKAHTAKAITCDTKNYLTTEADLISKRMADFFANNFGACTIKYQKNSISAIENQQNIINYDGEEKRKNLTLPIYETSSLSDPRKAIYHERMPLNNLNVRNLFDIDPKSTKNNEFLINGGFFLLDPEEDDSSYTALGDPFGLLISEYNTISFPTIKRPIILLLNSGEIAYDRLSAEDFLYGFNDNWITPNEIIYRTNRTENLLTQVDKNSIDYILTNGYIVAIIEGGRAEVPINGIALRFNKNLKPEWSINQHINCKPKNLNELPKFAIQCGPTLIMQGRNVLTRKSFIEDNLFSENKTTGLIPIRLDRGYLNGCNRPKTCFGKNKNGDLVWKALFPYPGEYISLFDLANDITETDSLSFAIALDGGGSARLYHAGKRIAGDATERRGIPYFLSLS